MGREDDGKNGKEKLYINLYRHPICTDRCFRKTRLSDYLQMARALETQEFGINDV